MSELVTLSMCFTSLVVFTGIFYFAHSEHNIILLVIIDNCKLLIVVQYNQSCSLCRIGDKSSFLENKISFNKARNILVRKKTYVMRCAISIVCTI